MNKKQLALRVLGAGGILAGVGAVGLLADAWSAFGKAAVGERLARMEQSAQWADGRFVNARPMFNDYWLMVKDVVAASPFGSPAGPIDVVQTDPEMLRTPPPDGVRLTWFGHSSMLLEIDGSRVLIDPVWGERSGPLTHVGPRRWYPPPIALDALPAVDAVVISHDHYDHLDEPTLRAIADWDTRFHVPLGVGAHLEYWGVPADSIVELDWWEESQVGDLRIVATPARHASGRHAFDQMATLWAGYAFIGPEHRVFYSGDTGMFPEFADIGERLGPFDMTMIEVGAYNRAWPDWHIGPEQAVEAHQMVKGDVFVPVHWGLFNLAYHSWTEPIERTRVAAETAGVRYATPRPGESVVPRDPSTTQWWPDIEWQSAAEHPIRSTKLD